MSVYLPVTTNSVGNSFFNGSLRTDSLALTSIDQFYFFIFRSDNNKITVENYGETVQDRPIPNPVRTFGEAYADYRKFLSFVKVNRRNTHGNPHSCI